MLLLSISATGIIFIRKGGGREEGRSRSLRYAPQTNLCFLNYLCQLRFYKLNKSITQVYFEPAGHPEGSVAHLQAHWCAIPPRATGTWRDMCHPIPHPPHTRCGSGSTAEEALGKTPNGATTEGCALQREGRPEPFCTAKQSPRGHCSRDRKKGESNKLGNHLQVRRLVR